MTASIKDTSADLTSGQLECYTTSGFLHLRNFFGAAEPTKWSEECDRLLSLKDVVRADNLRMQHRPHATMGKILDRFDPVTDISPVLRSLAEDPRVKAVVRELLGDDGLLFKDKLIIKRPGTAGYGLHQDYPYYASTGLVAEALLSLMVSIDGADATNGALALFPGLHKAVLPSPADDPRDVDESSIDMTTGTVLVTSPRDLVVFHSLTPHRSGPNLSNNCRRALYLTYSAARFGDRSSNYHQHRISDRRIEPRGTNQADLYFR